MIFELNEQIPLAYDSLMILLILCNFYKNIPLISIGLEINIPIFESILI